MPHASLPRALSLRSFSMSQVGPLIMFYSAVDVMQIAHDHFKDGVAYFTRRTISVSRWHVQMGTQHPFLGPNTFVCWAALEDAMLEDAGDHKKRKIWSEAHVSEEFDMALRLMVFVFRVSVAPDSDGHTQMDTPSGGRHTQKVASRNVSR